MRVPATITTVLLSIAVLSYNPDTYDNAQLIENHYLKILDSVDIAANNLEKIIMQGDKVKEQTCFKKLRVEYKKLSILTDYLNPYESILFNNPAIQRSEDDNPTIIIEPHGFQQLESLIWGNDTSIRGREQRLYEIKYIIKIIFDLKNEEGKINKFNDVMVWDAMRYAAITLTTKTIAGFDSPIALYAIDEAKATIDGIASIINIYKATLKQADQYYCDSINATLQNAKRYLSRSVDFNRFDRLYFIKNIVIPLSDNLSTAAIQLGYINKNERRALNPQAMNIFSKDVFDINFFSPNRRYQFTQERMLLGKKLFYDAELSGNGQRSCASCHKPELAFTDGLSRALSIDNKTALSRNTPTLLNAMFQTKLFYDSREPMLEFQVSSVVHNEKEMGGSMATLAQHIKNEKEWSTLFSKAYPDEKDPVNMYTIANAIASYLRSLLAMNTRFDQYMRDEPVILSASEKNGFNLFMGKAKCGTCHFIPLFNGLVPPQFTETESEVIGVPSGIKKPFTLDADSGKYYFTKSEVHLYAFKTPTLRNIALTAPYMHNGIYKTLEEVVDFYNDGGGKGLHIAPSNQTLPFDKLDLSKAEKKDIIRFLFTLTDTTSYKALSN